MRKKTARKTDKNLRGILAESDYLILLLIFIDQVSKLVVISSHIFPVIYNRGISFGLLPQIYWLGINSVILLVLIGLNYKYKSLPLSMILAGGLANFIDRILRGVIIDFIHLPLLGLNFNLADIFITVGAGLLIYKNLLKWK